MKLSDGLEPLTLFLRRRAVRQVVAFVHRRVRAVLVAVVGGERCSSCGVRNLGSRGGAVFMDESAESVSALDCSCGRVRDLQLARQGIGRLEIE